MFVLFFLEFFQETLCTGYPSPSTEITNIICEKSENVVYVIYALVRKKGEKLGVSVKSASTMWQMKCTRNSNRQAGGVEIWGKGENGFSMAFSVALGGVFLTFS